MRKIELVQIFKNVSSGWVALATNILVGVFLSPYILHRLGDAAFGIWVLIFSLTGYYGLFDLGIRSSIVRYVSKATARDDLEQYARVINTSLFSYTCIGAFAFLVTVVVSVYIDRIFHIPATFTRETRWLLVMAGSGVALGFPLGVSGGVLEGLQSFYVLNWTSIISTLVRALLIVLSLRHGGGLLMVAFITVTVPVISAIVRSAVVLRMLPVSLGLAYVDRKTLREMANYSGTTLIMIVSARLRFKSDSIIIGTFLSSVAITYFNIGARIVDYAGEVVESLAQVFVPMSSHSDARGDINRLRKIFVAGNRFCAFTIFPIGAILIILGKSVIEAWVGKQYITQSYPVMLVLLIPTMLMLSQAASGRVLFGISQHRTWALVTLIEGIVNILLSIALVRPYGIMGDALGTAIPLAATMIFFLPGHVCRKLQIPVRTFLREAYSLPIAVCAPMVLTLLLMKHRSVPHTYGSLAIHLGVAGLVYGSALLWAFSTKRAMKVGRLSVGEVGDVMVPATTEPGVETLSPDV
jgi:O-antigen/teichoic acid export membrane protein